MKRRLLIVVASLLVVIGVEAQNTAGSLEIRPMAGLSLTGFRGQGAKDTNHQLGGLLGGEIEYRATTRLGLSGGVLFSLQGCSIDNSGADEASCNLAYLNVPLLLNYYITDKIAVKAGVQPGFLLESKVKAKQGKVTGEIKTNDMFKRFDLAIPMGVSFGFNHFQIDARYNLSLLNIAKEYTFDGVTYDAANLYNSVVQVTLGYNFYLK